MFLTLKKVIQKYQFLAGNHSASVSIRLISNMGVLGPVYTPFTAMRVIMITVNID